jgi:hypothetical protein
VIDWRRVPWTLWVWAVGIVASTVDLVVTVHHHSGWHHMATILLTLVLLSLWPYFMFKGVRWLWIATVGGIVLFFVIDIATGHQNWFGVLIAVAQLVLLLLPVTRRFFASSNSRAAPG